MSLLNIGSVPMKSKHRHELKTNELADWIKHLPEWIQDNAKTIGIVAAVLVITAAVAWWYNYNTHILSTQEKHRLTHLLAQVVATQARAAEGSMQGNDISNILTQPADDLASFARSSPDDTMAALAYIKRGEVMRAELHYRFNLLDKATIAARMEQAQKSYQQALEHAGSNPSLKALALFGIGLCAEEIGDFNEAKAQYQAVVNDPVLAGTVAVEVARDRLHTFHAYQDVIVFKPAKEPNETAMTDILKAPFIPAGQEQPVDSTEQIGPMQEPVGKPMIVETDSNTLSDD